MDPEQIVFQTVQGLKLFLKDTFEEHVYETFTSSVCDWSTMWERIKQWLLHNPMRDTHSTVLAFAETLPDYDSFEWQLKQSLTLHERFWNQVYSNLCRAKVLLDSR
ncbi:hypothetical protein AVEN_32489-1 [Araneus ventricosus]|uniref:Uncharacterized protein n=1 Tax=Araneus ventricosus TaxID=182803 RepID=A0A4Y2C9A9_ARAVE|nr:hypothetical protein AVEN_32489-1 [Araneus ventricosus]